MQSRYKEGEIVYDRIRPNQKLIVKKFFKGVYYCIDEGNSRGKELIYMEGELITRPEIAMNG